MKTNEDLQYSVKLSLFIICIFFSICTFFIFKNYATLIAIPTIIIAVILYFKEQKTDDIDKYVNYAVVEYICKTLAILYICFVLPIWISLIVFTVYYVVDCIIERKYKKQLTVSVSFAPEE